VATDAISICSRALVLIGAGAIASFEEGPAAATAAQLYPGVRDSLLSKHPWRFARSTARLARLAAAPDFWRGAFRLPSDCLVLRGLRRTADPAAPAVDLWDRQGEDVVANEDDLFAIYTRRVPEGAFPPWFAHLLTYATAAELALPVTDSGTLADRWTIRAFGTPGEGGTGGEFAVARRVDAQQQPAETLPADTFTGLR
jgi:hypothetical protein